VAAQLAARGAFVVALARDDASAAAAAAAAAEAAAVAGSGGRAEGIACDLSSVAAVAEAARAIAARHPELHLLVCNAAVARWGGAVQRTPDGHEVCCAALPRDAPAC
jgi:NAD(P)-dependent dehydrogenase (short-subunit alcohol dehydrogenase family)